MFRLFQTRLSATVTTCTRCLTSSTRPPSYVFSRGISNLVGSSTVNRASSNDTAKISLLHCVMPLVIPKRSNTSFFNKATAAQLWKGVTSVSNAGKKRGRGKGAGRRIVKDLNRGQIIGVGKINMVWPGLNSPIIRGKEVVQQRELPPDENREARLLQLRENQGKFKRIRLSPLERGWSGAKMHGRSIGPPDPVGNDKFEGFDTRVMEMKTVTNMDGNLGRIKRFSCMAFTGNKQGLAGFALGKNPEGRAALKRAKNRAAQKLVYIQRYENHTVMHDFHTQFGQTQIYVFKKPEGFGLVCHRAIKTMCELIGIKDLYAKIEGPTTVQNIVKAFMLGLLRQKTHEDLANEKGLYLVEQRPDTSMFPKVVGVPEICRTENEIPSTEVLDFRIAAFDGKLPLKKKRVVPFYTRLPGWQNHLIKTEHRRNHQATRIKLLAEYGGTKLHPRSFLTKKYPECDAYYHALLHQKRLVEEKTAEE